MWLMSPLPLGGRYEESNYELATRAMRSLASVDSGTRQGLQQIVNLTAGIQESNMVTPGDSLMERDVDSKGSHKGSLYVDESCIWSYER